MSHWRIKGDMTSSLLTYCVALEVHPYLRLKRSGCKKSHKRCWSLSRLADAKCRAEKLTSSRLFHNKISLARLLTPIGNRSLALLIRRDLRRLKSVTLRGTGFVWEPGSSRNNTGATNNRKQNGEQKRICINKIMKISRN